MTDLRFPVGEFQLDDDNLTDEQRQQFIQEIAETPARLREAVEGLSDEQLDTPYRPDGWTVRQVVHHVPDSHLNNYIRVKFALTEDEPTIKPYDEAVWAEMADSVATPIEVSLTLLESLHARWIVLLNSLSPEDFKRVFHHPERGAVSLNMNVALYAWHGRHHVAHITSLRERMGWN
ncbi:MAG: putative metal-dependent hydrolase [Pyrinomonadaceae bacterium]|nr:putative metal-dependent hydrolase [Pyrinomonadaceae bacterium]